MTNRYEVALIKKEGPVSKLAINTPERAGPIKRPALKFAELRLTALATSLSPTISAVKLCLIGASIAEAIPRTAAQTKTCQSSITSATTKMPSA